MLGPRLRIHEGSQISTARWRRVSIADIFAVFALPLALGWGGASALGVEEIFDIRVIPMSTTATVIYWAVVALLAAHFVANRSVLLVVGPSEITCRVGRVPGRVRVVERQGSVTVSIETREDAIAETSAGQSIDHTTLSIRGAYGGVIVIDDLSEDDARRVEALFEGRD